MSALGALAVIGGPPVNQDRQPQRRLQYAPAWSMMVCIYFSWEQCDAPNSFPGRQACPDPSLGRTGNRCSLRARSKPPSI